MSAYPHGECECRDGCQCEHRAGPAAYEFARNGKTMRVCTRCDFSSDRETRRLLVTKDDDARAYFHWDVLGFVCISGELSQPPKGEPESAEVPS